MKKTDIALLIIIISISVGLSWWIVSSTLGKANDEPITVRTVEEIKADKNTEVDKRVFSSDAINPTVETTIKGEDLTSFVDDENDSSTDTNDASSSNTTPASVGE